LAGEARARIKINQLLEKAGWRFFGDAHGPANIQLEAGTKITRKQVDAREGDKRIMNLLNENIYEINFSDVEIFKEEKSMIINNKILVFTILNKLYIRIKINYRITRSGGRSPCQKILN
jgi:hypothetical protein